MHYSRVDARPRGFSLIELVIVVVVIGIITAIAVPRLSRGAAGATDSSVIGDLKVIRNALEHYAAEHGGNYPGAADVTNALLGYTDETGGFPASPLVKDADHPFGPYLRAIPPLPVGANKGAATIGNSPTDGWKYDPATTEKVTANTTSEADGKGVPYNTY